MNIAQNVKINALNAKFLPKTVHNVKEIDFLIAQILHYRHAIGKFSFFIQIREIFL